MIRSRHLWAVLVLLAGALPVRGEDDRSIEVLRFECRTDTTRHPGMHKTRTIDYVVLLSGEVTMLLDKGEVDLKPFDVVVQRGTSHAWVNKGKEPALLAAVLIDAKPV